jgi:nicotinamidase-related amidase
MTAVTEKGRLLTDEERLNPAHTALVLIDIQNDFCDPDGLFGRLGNDLSMMPAMAERTRALLDTARRKGMLVLFVRATYDGEVLSAPLAETYNRRGFVESQCLEGSFSADWYSGLGPDPAAPNEVVITKHRFSVFWGTDFDLYLRANQIRTLVFTGVVTSGCVESSLRDAFFRDYYVVCVSDCVAEASPARHAASLHKIEQAFGAVRDSADIAAIWERSTSAPPGFTAAAKRDRALRGLAARVDPAHCALLLIDLQRDFCSADGAIGRSVKDLTPVGASLKQASKLLTAARAAGMQVIHVRSECGELDASEVSLLAGHSASGAQWCQPGTAGAAFMPEVTPRPGEWLVTKHRLSAFVDTRLELLLRSNGIRTLIVAGVSTPGAVESTVRDASMRDYYVVVARDAVAAPVDLMHLHAASLEAMSVYFADCRPAAEIIAALPAQRTAAA